MVPFVLLATPLIRRTVDALSDGSYLFTIRSGWKPIEFDKGKSAIVVLSQDKLPTIIDTFDCCHSEWRASTSS
jgi:hypothetical protein